MRLLDSLNTKAHVPVQPAELEQPVLQPAPQLPLSQPSVLEKGLRRGLGGLGASARSFLAQQAEPFAPEWSRRNIAEANAYMQDLIRATPMVDRIEDIKSPGDFGEWLVGTTAQAAPSLATALGGAALGRVGLRRLMNPTAASFVGAGAVSVPMEGGETAMQLHADPVALANTTPSERANLSLIRGLSGAALESFVPAMTVNKLMRDTPLMEAGLRPALGHVAKTGFKGGIGESLTEGGQYLVGQMAHKAANPDIELVDNLDLANVMAAGFAPGMILGTAGGTADVIYGNAQAGANKVSQAAKDYYAGAKETTRDYYRRAEKYVKDKVGSIKWPGKMTEEDVVKAAYNMGDLTRRAGESVNDAYTRFMRKFVRDSIKQNKPFEQRVVEWEDEAIRAFEDAGLVAKAAGVAAKRGYEGTPLVDPNLESSVDPIFGNTGKSFDQVSEEILNNANINTADEETFLKSAEEQWNMYVKPIAEVLAKDVNAMIDSKFSDELFKLLGDPNISRDPKNQRRIIQIAKEWRDKNKKLGALLRELPPEQGSASRQMTEDEEIFDQTVQQFGITDKQLRERLLKLSRNEDALAKELVRLKASGIIDESGQRVLLDSRPKKVEEPLVVRIPKTKKPKGALAEQLSNAYYDENFLGLRVREYVGQAVKGTDFDNDNDREVIEKAIVRMLESISRDELTHSQVHAIRFRLEDALGQEGVSLFDAILEAAASYADDNKFRALRTHPDQEVHIVSALDRMRHDASKRAIRPRPLLNRLVIALLDAEKATNEFSSKQWLKRQIEYLNSQGKFLEAVKLENYFNIVQDFDPYNKYYSLLEEHFGKKKSKSADIMVRKYLKDLRFEISEKPVRSTDTGKLMEDDTDDTDESVVSVDLYPDLDEEARSEVNEKLGLPDDVDSGFGDEIRYFGQSGKNLGKYDKYPGAPLTTRATYENPDGEVRKVIEDIEAKWPATRIRVISVIDWAEEQKGNTEEILNMAAEAMIRHDADRLKKLKGLRNDAGKKLHKNHWLEPHEVQSLIEREIKAIENRAELWEGSRSGTMFFNHPNNSNLKYIEVAPAKGTMLEFRKGETDRFEIPATEAQKQKWIAGKLGLHNAETLNNSLIRVRAKDGKIFYHDIAANVARMLRRYKVEDVSGVFEDEPTLPDLVRGAFANTITSLLMSNEYSQDMLVDGFNNNLVIYRDDATGRSLTYGQVFGSKADKTADFGKEELDRIVPKNFTGNKRYIAPKALIRNGVLANFNPRALITIMGKRYGMDMEEILPTGQPSDGLSAELTDKLMKEGMDILKRAGYEMAHSSFDKLPTVLWEVEYADGKIFPVTAGSSFYRKKLIEQAQLANEMSGFPPGPSWGEYKGTFDIKSDRITAQSEKVENLTKRLAKAVKELESVNIPKNKDVSGKLTVLKDEVNSVREQLDRATDKLFEMMDWSLWEDNNAENKFSPDEMENIRIKNAYKEALRPIERNIIQDFGDDFLTRKPAPISISEIYSYSDFDSAERYADLYQSKTVDEIEHRLKSVHWLRTQYQSRIESMEKEGKPVPDLRRKVRFLNELTKKLNEALVDAKEEEKAEEEIKVAREKERASETEAAVSEPPVRTIVEPKSEGTDVVPFEEIVEITNRISAEFPTLKASNVDSHPEAKAYLEKIMTLNLPSRQELIRLASEKYGYNPRPGALMALSVLMGRRDRSVGSSTQAVDEKKDVFNTIVDVTESISEKFPDLKNTNINEYPGAKAQLEQLMAMNILSAGELKSMIDNKYAYDDPPGALKAFLTMVNLRERGAKLSMQTPEGKKDQSEEQVKADIQRRLGDTVDFFMREVLPNNASGRHTPPGPDRLKAMLEVSMKATNWRGTAAHESWHEVERLLNEMGEDGKHILDVIHKAMTSERTYTMLKEHFKDDPGVLTQIEPGEGHDYLSERASFAFQLYVQNEGKLPLPPKVRRLFTKILDMFKRLLGITDDLVKTGNFFKYFDTGEFAKNMKNPKSVLEGLAETRREKYAQQLGRALRPLRKLAFAAFGHAADRILEMKIPAYTEILRRMHRGEGANVGYMHEHRVRMQAFFNEYSALASEHNGKIPPEALEKFIKKIENYKADAAKNSKTPVQFDRARQTLPPVFDLEKIEGRLEEFKKDLKAYGGLQDTSPEGIEEIVDQIFSTGHYSNDMLFRDYPEKAEKYTSEDMDRRAFAYIRQATHEAEMAKAFSDLTLEQLLNAGDKDATPYQRRLIRTFIDAAQGRAGKDLNPQLRKLFGIVITGINLSLLPFAVFTQMIEPLQLAFRKNDLKSSVDSAFRGFKSLPRMFRPVDEAVQRDFFEKTASELGLITDAVTVSMMADLMNEVPVTGMLDKINKAFFRYNGMEFWHRAMYSAATKNAFSFIKEHDKNPTKNSDALLAELGLKRGEIKYTEEGEVDHHDPKVRAAIIRFATQSMAQPDAATNAMWMNDPRMALISHLKRFTFGFAYYINSRAIQHIRDRNFKALAPLAFAVPWMIITDSVRDMLRPGEETWKNNWGVTEYTLHGIERSGLLGRYGLGTDALKTIEFGGSAVEAISPAAQITGKVARGVSEGHGWEALFNTLPGHQLYGV